MQTATIQETNSATELRALTFTREGVNFGDDQAIGTMTTTLEQAEGIMKASGADRAWANWGRKGQAIVLFKGVMGNIVRK